MADAGIFMEDDRIELIEGEVVEMSPIGSFHASVVDILNQELNDKLRKAATVRVQNPAILNFRTEPEPDIILLKQHPRFYRDKHPGPEDILLIIEVADSSLHYDRYTKMPLYARTGVVESWIVNLVDGAIEIHRQPSPEGYRVIEICRGQDTVSPLAFPEIEIRVEEIVGEARESM